MRNVIVSAIKVADIRPNDIESVQPDVYVKDFANTRVSLPVRIYRFYRDGFRNMTIGRSLWVLILIKLAIIFLVLKLFFFPDFLGTKSANEGVSRGDAVINEMTDRTTR